MVTLRWGLANSENNISAWVLKQFTPEAVAQMAHKMGITSFIDPVPSVFLGTAEITVKEMVAAYSIFANKGVYNSIGLKINMGMYFRNSVPNPGKSSLRIRLI